jgi:predicted membrane channel-forming protein YqfA (hemolysin III family)
MLRIPSRVTFWLAALALAGVGIELVLLPEPGRANNGALLVFLLLGVALVSSVFETRRLEAKNKLTRRR